MNFAVVLVLLAAAGSVSSATLPSYIKTCKYSDPKLNDCLVMNGREAIPHIIDGDAKLGVPKLDPLEIEKLVVGDGMPGNGLGITLTCNKCKIGGLRGVRVDDAKLDLKKQHIEIKAFVPQLTVAGQYTAEGKVLVLPISGNGNANITLGDLKLVYNIDYDLKKGKGGKEFIHLKTPKLDFKAEKFHIHLTNLFNGDKKLGNEMNLFLNENWRDVLKEFGPAIGETVNKVVFMILNSITEKISFDDVIPK